MSKKLVITEYKNYIADLLFSDFKLQELYLFPKKDIIGNIYVAVIKNIVKNLNAAFVEYEENKMAFLPLNTNQLLNLHEGETVLIQIEKAAVKTKDPVATTNISLNGLYSVVTIVHSNDTISYSKKLSLDKKNELIEYFNKNNNAFELLKNYQLSAVIRTAVNEIEDYDLINNELDYLSNKLNTIINEGIHRTAFTLLYENQNQYLKQIMKFSSTDYDELITDQDYIFHLSSKVLAKDKLRFYDDKEYSLDKLYSIDSNIENSLNKKVYLKSGGNIIIEHTEALTVIDINTGKNIKKLKSEELAFETNMEAASEIAKQLILRNISGIIIIDFINMKKTEHIDNLSKQLKKLCKKDRIQCDFVDFTALGLAELTRKKISPPLYELLD